MPRREGEPKTAQKEEGLHEEDLNNRWGIHPFVISGRERGKKEPLMQKRSGTGGGEGNSGKG